jgi:queuosine precursor transporter
VDGTPARSLRVVGFLSVGLFVATIFLANWAISKWGPVPVGFGLEAPAGVYFAGIALTLRDVIHRQLGRWVVVAAILVGGLLTLLVSTDFAVASATAFLFSEFADLAVYEPLRRRGWLVALAVSNAVGLVVDSVVFLWLAFRSLEFLDGQILAKTWTTLLAIGVIAIARGALRPQPDIV